MTYPSRPRSYKKNGAKWTKIAGVAKRQWEREPGPTLCHLCYGEIDTTAPTKADRSLSIDHVIPVATDPTLEYRLSNLKPACWICNSVRGDRPLEEVHADIPGFKREVGRAIARRRIREEEKADKAVAAARDPLDHPPYSRNWWTGGPPVETPDAKAKRIEAWRRLPPDWM